MIVLTSFLLRPHEHLAPMQYLTTMHWIGLAVAESIVPARDHSGRLSSSRADPGSTYDPSSIDLRTISTVFDASCIKPPELPSSVNIGA